MNKLHPFQQKVLEECLQKKSGGLSLPMGSGKTLISLCLGLKYCKNDNDKILVVASKSLIHSWEQEIQKWLPDISYKFYNLTDFNPNNPEKIILTTPTTLSKFYKLNNIQNIYIDVLRNGFEAAVNYYIDVTQPLGSSGFYGFNFKTLLVDEAHTYTNITTQRSRAICSISAEHRWLLSGTLFAEPKVEHILGFHRMIMDTSFPNNLPRAIIYVKRFAGVRSKIVNRKNNEMFVNKPKLIKNIQHYKLEDMELAVYLIFKDLIRTIYGKLLESKRNGHNHNVRLYNASLLSLIVILRLSLISPMICISDIFLKCIDTDETSSLYPEINKALISNGIMEYIKNPKYMISQRIKLVVDAIQKHPNEQVLIFSAFRKA